MAKFVLTDASVTIGGNDISDHVQSVTINYAAEVQDCTAMGDSSRNRLGGLKDWSAEIELQQDFAASNVDSIMFPLVGTSVTVAIRPTSASVSATNPNYNGNAILESYPPLGNGVGDLSTSSISLQGNGDLSRSTS
jgi:hypothetical protein